jgi:hypothetical protein
MSCLGHARPVVCTKVLLTWEQNRLELIAAVQLEWPELASQGLDGLVGGDASDELALLRVAELGTNQPWMKAQTRLARDSRQRFCRR